MIITYLGHSSFKLSGKDATVITDPYSSDMVGLKFPKHLSAQIVTVSHEHEDHNVPSLVEGDPFVIRGPGEYEVKGVGVVGLSVFHDSDNGRTRGKNTIYRIEIDGLTVVHLGDLGHVLTTTSVETLDGVDVLLIPTGGYYTIGPKEAVEVVKEIEPLITIPMHYNREQLNQKTFANLTPVSAFLKEIGKDDITPIAKLNLSRDKLPEEPQVVVME